MQKSELLFIGATHGDEPNGVEVLKQLEAERSDFDWIIGNEKAYEQGTRGFEGDLNRSAPGSKNGTDYASRRAAEIIDTSQNYKYTIDLHGSPKEVGNIIIMTKLTEDNIKLATLFDIDRIVYWPAVSPELDGPLSEFFPCGFEIESGPKTDPVVQKELQDKIRDFLDNYQEREKLDWREEIKKKKVFVVYGSLTSAIPVKLEEFQEVNVDGERFFPLLINSYLKRNGVVCYKMRQEEDVMTLI